MNSVTMASECSMTSSYRHWIDIRSALQCACQSQSKGSLFTRD